MIRHLCLSLCLLALIVPTFAQSKTEMSVLRSVQEMMQESGGRVTFSTLHNDPRFSGEEKEFLNRLYEIFFQIPGFLAREFESTGKVPNRTQIGAGFGISARSVELLLRVMESDNRVPPLFTRDEETGELNSLKLDNIKAFVESRGDQVRITDWAGQQTPAFELEQVGGGQLTSNELSGKPHLLYFWFTGCPPCVRIAPILAELDKEYRKQGFQIVGFNADRVLEIDVTEEQRIEYLKKSDTTYANLHLDEDTRSAFGNINVYPTLFFVGRDGRVHKHLLNFQDRETLESVMQQLLK